MGTGKYNIPIPQRYCLTIEEAAAYSLIGENRLRRIIDEDRNADFILWSGRNARIKRVAFERYLDKLTYV
ncbi:MAG: excisionase [Candidatus Ornithomonoglobus sp.]